MDPADRAYITEIMAQLNMARERKQEAEEELGVWTDRMALAKSKGAHDLYEGAKERALRAQEVIRQAESAIMELEVEKSTAKSGVRVGEPETVAATQRAVERLKGTDLDPDHARLDRMVKQEDASDALSELKRKMGMD